MISLQDADKGREEKPARTGGSYLILQLLLSPLYTYVPTPPRSIEETATACVGKAIVASFSTAQLLSLHPPRSIAILSHSRLFSAPVLFMHSQAQEFFIEVGFVTN